MTEDNMARVSSSDPSASKQRKKRKWDQPAEHVVSAGIAASGLLPLSHVGSLLGTSLPGVALVSGVYFSNPLAATVPTVRPFVQVPPQQHMLSISQKLNQIQDEVIAREIVINEADSTVRYKLTKRQTQEEIQKSTGAIVITRGKYRPPNAPPDSEKPLYLHISAGAHLETTVERIKAVDHAAAMVEEMLKQGSSGNVNHSLSACVYLGFEVDPSVDIAARIRGPNDQYVNHIMNETGATVLLRGHGLGNSESTGADGQQPLYLFLSSNNVKSLERAKLLAENLLDTISAEFSVSRFSSSKVYGAVPPPPQLLAEVQSSVDESKAKMQPAASSTSSALGCSASAVGPLMVPAASIISPQGPVTQLGCSNSGPGPSQGFSACYSHSTLSCVTSYNGYGGIYPQATPLQQVALALRHSTSPITTASTGSHASTSSSLEKEKRSSQKRKFQESPVVVKGLVNPSQKSMQVSEVAKPCGLNPHVVAKDIKKLMPPPPMPPPPPKFTSSSSSRVVGGQNVRSESKSESVPDTLIKLMEYGDEDDDELEEPSEEEPLKRSSNSSVTTKPFWAV